MITITMIMILVSKISVKKKEQLFTPEYLVVELLQLTGRLIFQVNYCISSIVQFLISRQRNEFVSLFQESLLNWCFSRFWKDKKLNKAWFAFFDTDHINYYMVSVNNRIDLSTCILYCTRSDGLEIKAFLESLFALKNKSATVHK